MLLTLVIATAVISSAALVASVVLLRRFAESAQIDFGPVIARCDILTQELSRLREAQLADARGQRTEMTDGLDRMRASNDQRLDSLREVLDARLRSLQEDNGKQLEAVRLTVDGVRAASEQRLECVRAAVDSRLRSLQDDNSKQLEAVRVTVDGVRATSEQRLEAVREAIDVRLRTLQEENAKKLEEMRQTVDEKLQGTLEKRLGESFKLVSERLEQVHKGLGEMQSLATGVGDLKKVLTNVKARGTWGEVQLGSLLEQILTPEQFAHNVAVSNTLERVEYAIRLPGNGDGPVWLPIDSKFPQEDYQRLVDASEAGDAGAVEFAAKCLEANIRASAKKIREKYLCPPNTTDFGILFVPTEGLYAEVHRRPGLADALQRDCRVMVAGPSTLCAMLNSLQMGFRTLAIQQRSSEVWHLLGDVKTEFDKFSGVLDKIKKKLTEASNTVDEAAKRTRVMNRKLRQVNANDADAGEQLALEAHTAVMIAGD